MKKENLNNWSDINGLICQWWFRVSPLLWGCPCTGYVVSKAFIFLLKPENWIRLGPLDWGQPISGVNLKFTQSEIFMLFLSLWCMLLKGGDQGCWICVLNTTDHEIHETCHFATFYCMTKTHFLIFEVHFTRVKPVDCISLIEEVTLITNGRALKMILVSLQC